MGFVDYILWAPCTVAKKEDDSDKHFIVTALDNLYLELQVQYKLKNKHEINQTENQHIKKTTKHGSISLREMFGPITGFQQQNTVKTRSLLTI